MGQIKKKKKSTGAGGSSNHNNNRSVLNIKNMHNVVCGLSTDGNGMGSESFFRDWDRTGVTVTVSPSSLKSLHSFLLKSQVNGET